MSDAKAWNQSMPDEQFAFMRDLLAAPSPIGLEAAMTHGVLKPRFESFMPKGWAIHQYRGNAGIVLDTKPGRDDLLSVMIIGHADKIRLQVRSIGEDGKIWVDSDSFLPSVLVGHEVILFSADPEQPGEYREIRGGTLEAVGAIHFADSNLRSGDRGIRKNMLYLELQVHGEDKKKQIDDWGIRPGDPIILDRTIRRGFSPDTFYGAYLDNGLGCFVTAECARLVAEHGDLDNVRVMFAIAAYEEIGRFGSRVLAGEHRPDVIVGVDVNHDYVAAPNVAERRLTPLEMGKGYTLSYGSIASEYLNTWFERVSEKKEIPVQRSVAGRDTGTDAMAGVLASVDSAATSIGFPIRNMHTISETAHTGDVLAALHAMLEVLVAFDQANDGSGLNADNFRGGHPRLDKPTELKKKKEE